MKGTKIDVIDDLVKQAQIFEISPGSCFQHKGELFIKTQKDDRSLSLKSGFITEIDDSTWVVLVNVQLHVSEYEDE